MRQVSIYGLLAIGMTFVILTAGIDLSVGSLLAMAGLVAAAVSKGGLSNRFTVGEGQDAVELRLVSRGACRDRGRPARRLRPGAGDHAAEGTAVRGDPRRHVGLPRRGAALRRGRADQRLRPGLRLVGPGPASFGQVPIPVIIFLAFAVLAHIVLRYTRYGRQVYAVGGNPEAARLSGLNVRVVITSVYVIMGFFAGLGSFVLAARLNSAEAVAGTGYELTVIASVVIGGTSLFGGTGTIFGTVIGTDPDRRVAQRPRPDERLVLHPADHYRRHHRARGGLRHLRQVASPDGVRAA